ncbi:MAG: hypothetical protein PUC74_03645 [Succinatimonas sp.]|nr:hypothetical protein [Succinatimonas sp.]
MSKLSKTLVTLALCSALSISSVQADNYFHVKASQPLIVSMMAPYVDKVEMTSTQKDILRSFFNEVVSQDVVDYLIDSYLNYFKGVENGSADMDVGKHLGMDKFVLFVNKGLKLIDIQTLNEYLVLEQEILDAMDKDTCGGLLKMNSGIAQIDSNYLLKSMRARMQTLSDDKLKLYFDIQAKALKLGFANKDKQDPVMPSELKTKASEILQQEMVSYFQNFNDDESQYLNKLWENYLSNPRDMDNDDYCVLGTLMLDAMLNIENKEDRYLVLDLTRLK